MAFAKLLPFTIKPNAPGAWWIEWRQGRSDSIAGTTKIADFGRPIWRARYSFSRRSLLGDLNPIAAFFMGLQGWAEPFRVPVYHDSEARLGSGTVTPAVSGVVGRSLQTVGWTIGGSTANGTVMKAGQFFALTVAPQEPRLQMLTADAVATGGAATLECVPGIQVAAPNTEHLDYKQAGEAGEARASMILSNPDRVVYQINTPVTGSIDVELEEWWPDRPQ